MVASTASTSTIITGHGATVAWAIVPSTAPRTADTTAASATAKLINMARRSSVAKALIHDTVAAPTAALASVARKNTTPWIQSSSRSGITRSEKNVMLRPIGTNTIWVARNSRYQLRVRTTVTPSR